MPCGVYSAPPHRQGGPLPLWTGGERRPVFLLPSAWGSHYSLLPLLTTYYLLLTTYYFNSYFLSFFSPFTKKTLTNFNIQGSCFANYMGHPSADNTYNFSYNTNNFSFSPNNFSDSPRNFSDFPAIFGIKKWRYPDLPGYLHFRTTKIQNFWAKCKSVNFR